MSPSSSRSNWPLLALSESPEGRLSPAQIQKTLFLFGKKWPKIVGREFYKFKPYNYGPFDSAVYSDLTALQMARHVRRVESGPRSSWSEYEITDRGRVLAKNLAKPLKEDTISYLRSVASWARSVPFSHLIRTIYKLYPEYRKNSVFEE